ncbi:MAG: haloacid dehalogenase type II [Pseudomonadota bacterium]
MRKPEDTRVCVFDAYGTLFDLTSATREHLALLGEHANQVASVWRAKQLEYSWLRSLMGAWAPFAQVVEEALDYALDSAGLAARRAEIAPPLLSSFASLDTFPEVPEVLRRLRAVGVQTAVLSNGSRDMLDQAVQAAGITELLDAVISVDEVRVFKPDPRVYQLALDRFSVEACRVSFQSSNSWDVAGAAHFGMFVVWCNRSAAPTERLPSGAHAEVSALDTLPDVLGMR